MDDFHRLELVGDGQVGGEAFTLKLDGFELKHVKGFSLGHCWSEKTDCLTVTFQIEPSEIQPIYHWSSTSTVS